MRKRLLSAINYTIAVLLSLFGLCNCSFQRHEYGCPNTYYQEMEPQQGGKMPAKDGDSDTLNAHKPSNKEEDTDGES